MIHMIHFAWYRSKLRKHIITKLWMRPNWTWGTHHHSPAQLLSFAGDRHLSDPFSDFWVLEAARRYSETPPEKIGSCNGDIMGVILCGLKFEPFNSGIMVGMMRIHPKLGFTGKWPCENQPGRWMGFFGVMIYSLVNKHSYWTWPWK